MFVHSDIAKRTSGLFSQYKVPHVDKESYDELYAQSISNPDKFFDRMAKEHLSFEKPYKTVLHGGFKDGDIQWFPEGSEFVILVFNHMTCDGTQSTRSK